MLKHNKDQGKIITQRGNFQPKSVFTNCGIVIKDCMYNFALQDDSEQQDQKGKK